MPAVGFKGIWQQLLPAVAVKPKDELAGQMRMVIADRRQQGHHRSCGLRLRLDEGCVDQRRSCLLLCVRTFSFRCGRYRRSFAGLGARLCCCSCRIYRQCDEIVRRPLRDFQAWHWSGFVWPAEVDSGYAE